MKNWLKTKRSKIFAISFVGISIISVAIAIPLMIENEEKQANKIREDIKKINKEIVLNEKNNLEIKDYKTKLIVKNAIIKKFVESKIFLSIQEKQSIEIVSKEGIINYKNPIKVKIGFSINGYNDNYIFKISRNKSNQEKIKLLIDKLNKLNSLQILNETKDIDISINNLLIKDFIVKKIKNITNEEKDAIQLITKEGKITYQDFINIEFLITFGSEKKSYIFKIKRTKSKDEINEEYFNQLKNKFDQVNLNQMFDDTFDIDIATNQIKIKQFIINRINKIKKNNKLTIKEEKAISLATTSGIITHTKAFNVNVNVIFGLKNKSYTFKITRAKSQAEINEENFNELKNKIDQVDLNQILSDEIDLDLANSKIQTKVKQFIFNKIDIANNSNKLSTEEKQTISLATTSGIINHTNITNVNIVINFDSNSKTYQFKLSRTKSNDEINLDKFNDLKSKIDQVNLTQTFSDEIDLDLANSQIQAKVKQFIFDKIDLANNINKLTIEEKQAISLGSTSGIITHTNTVNVNITITFNSNSKTYQFKLSRTKSNDEIDLDKFNDLKLKIDQVNLTQTFSDTLDIDIVSNKTKIKQFIFDKIDEANSSNKLSQVEKNVFSLLANSRIITHTNTENISISINFGSNVKIYTFKLSRTKSNDEIEFDNLKTKIEKINLNKNIVLDDEIDLDLNDISTKDKVKNKFFEAINDLNQNNLLIIEEKNAIKLISQNGIITNEIPLTIKFEISLHSFKKEYDFNFLRDSNDDESTKIFKKKLNKIKTTKLMINSSSDLNLQIEADRDIIKTFFVNLIDSKNTNKLSQKEINGLIVYQSSKIIVNSKYTIAVIGSKFGSINKYFVFQLMREKTSNEKMIFLKNKINNVNLKYILQDTINIDIASNQDKIKQFIFDQINIVNQNNELTNEEKNAINLTTISGTITHTIYQNVNIEINFQSLNFVYQFQLSRTISTDENNLINLHNKIKDKNKYFYLNISKKTIDLNIKQNRIDVKNELINILNQKLANINAHEKNALKIINSNVVIDKNNWSKVILEIKFNDQKKDIYLWARIK